MTQGEVASKLEWSLSKVNRIEIGDVTVSNTDLQALLRLFEVDDQNAIETLSGHCRSARQRGWWDEPAYRSLLRPTTIELMQFQSQAATIFSFHSAIFPGVIQTRAYAEHVLAFWAGELSDEERAARLDVRMKWRTHVFSQPRPPRHVLVVDESIVGREVGGPHVMIGQLRELLPSGHDPNIDVRVLPLRETAFLAAAAPFMLVEMGDGDAILYRESYLSDELVDHPAVIKRYREVVEQVLDTALSVEASARLIEACVAALVSSLDRR
ncbi:helix-turn-helix transcriptional regulator [Virgisporangium ochraceum]|uniref:Transcriptional regulator n=2 Tax=Virgisporangium ochraceum TaxID=65505 RepID=A0A8J3ZKA6_9ACTN|nr:transcriptional regulator [Virgisporangium ochraceum]